ncbi:MAG TPA: helix-turn-helix domain-containing protein [Terriglobales bacterium]|nr:helix-turn-helix domain-containing protein [Terriglobales bacterium]
MATVEWGEALARARRERGLSLNEVAAATKIGVRLLRAIEASDARALPGGIFNRSFIRTYARYLGLDDKPIVGAYLAVSGEEPSEAAAQPAPAPPGPAWLSPQLLLIVAVAIVVVVGGYAGVGLWRQSRRAALLRSRRQAPVTAAATPRPAPPVARDRGAALQATPTKPAAAESRASASVAAARAPASKPAPAGTVSLQISVTAPAWVKLQSNHKLILEDTLQPGPELSYQLLPPLRLVTGNAAAVHLTLDGTTQPSLGGDGAIAYWLYPPAAVPAGTPSVKGAAAEPTPHAGAAGTVQP